MTDWPGYTCVYCGEIFGVGAEPAIGQTLTCGCRRAAVGYVTKEQVEGACESVNDTSMLEFQHENVGKPRSTAGEAAQKIASNPLTYKG